MNAFFPHFPGALLELGVMGQDKGQRQNPLQPPPRKLMQKSRWHGISPTHYMASFHLYITAEADALMLQTRSRQAPSLISIPL